MVKANLVIAQSRPSDSPSFSFFPKLRKDPRLVRVSGVVVGGEGSRQGAGEPGAPRWADSDSGGELSSAFFTWAPPSGQRAGGDEGHCG